MAENQTKKKNKKTKKKSASKSSSNGSEAKSYPENLNVVPNNSNKIPNTKELLDLLAPKGIEVTVVQPSNNLEANADSVKSKKKKKSKKKSNVTKEAEPQTLGIDSNKSLLNFTENGIHLANNPEISVTFTNVPMPKVNEPGNKNEQLLSKEENKAVDNSASLTKKKKKRNKKKGDNPPIDAPTPTLPASSSENSNTIVTPTYTKVVTGDNTTLLLVNNDNLAAAAKTYANMEDSKSEKTQVCFIQDDKKTGDVLITKNLTHDAKFQLNNAVSIFPVLPSDNEIAAENNLVSIPNLDAVDSELKKDGEIVAENAEVPTKAQIKAERRAKQEAQRAAKQAAKVCTKTELDSGAPPKSTQKPTKETLLPKSGTITSSSPDKTAKGSLTDKDSLRKVRLFSHLPEHKQIDVNAKVHPAILEVGSQYNQGVICGSNARCISLLAALKEVIQDFKPQPGKNLCRELEASIPTYLSFINNCRPLSVSMTNAVKLLKHQINHMPLEIEDDKVKSLLCEFINNFVNEEILLAKEAISYSASEKIVDGDVILVFSYSSLVKHALLKAHREVKKFRVIVADSRPKLEGLEMLRCLVTEGLHCAYIPINAVSYAMKEVTKVIIGAHALLANGCVMSRLGCKQIALVASSYSVPVLVCCETYKFCERVLTDSFVHNELGEPNDISVTSVESKNSLKNWNDVPSLQLLNLLYDVTPSDLISMVITEKGVLPCTSVPVVLRVRYAGLHE